MYYNNSVDDMISCPEPNTTQGGAYYDVFKAEQEWAKVDPHAQDDDAIGMDTVRAELVYKTVSVSMLAFSFVHRKLTVLRRSPLLVLPSYT